MCSLFILVGLMFLVCGIKFLEAVCPSNPQEEISKCLHKIGIDNESEMAAGSVLISDTERARIVCSEGRLQTTITCMETVFNSCIEQKQRETLEKLVNLQRWRSGMNLLCDNLDSVLKNDKCIRDSNIESQVCVNEKTTEFRTKLQVKIMAGESSPNDIMTFSCKYADKIVYCMRKPLAQFCPADIRDVMTNVVKYFMPPICDPYWGTAETIGNANQFHSSVTLLILSGLIHLWYTW